MKHSLLYSLSIITLCFLASCGSMKDGGVAANKTADSIAVASGVAEFSKVKSLEFTFNVDKDSTHMERHWKWVPADNMVTFFDKTDSTVFKRMDTSTAELKKLNAQFTNDEYWLIFPLHLRWDKGYEFTSNDTATGPVTGKNYHKYTVQYNNKDGFTPGDMYELYIDGNHMIQEWAFHRGGSKDPTLMASWENYEDFNGLQISKEHKTSDGKFKLYFTGITITH